MCCFHMGIARKGGCKGLPGWFGALFSQVCPFDREGGVYLGNAHRNNTFQKGASLILDSIHSTFVLPQMEDVFQDSGRMSSHWQEIQLR